MRRLALWGQHLDEYIDMFALSNTDLDKRFLEYNSGASAFNTELTKRSLSCVSCDPWFDLHKQSLAKKIKLNFNERLKQLQDNSKNIDLTRYGSFENLIRYRQEGIDLFLEDYELGIKDGRYLAINGLELPFENFAFDFVLAANNFFSDLDFQTVEYHLTLIKELARVAKDVRIFPLVDTNGEPSSLLGPILLGLNQDNYGVEVRDVAYHLQIRGNAMLRVWAKQCQV